MLSGILSKSINCEIFNSLLNEQATLDYLNNLLRKPRDLSQKAHCMQLASDKAHLSITIFKYSEQDDTIIDARIVQSSKFPPTIPEALQESIGLFKFTKANDPKIKEKRKKALTTNTYSFSETKYQIPLNIPPLSEASLTNITTESKQKENKEIQTIYSHSEMKASTKKFKSDSHLTLKQQNEVNKCEIIDLENKELPLHYNKNNDDDILRKRPRNSFSIQEKDKYEILVSKRSKIQEWASKVVEKNIANLYPLDRPWGISYEGVTDILGLDCEWNNYKRFKNGKDVGNQNQVISLAIVNQYGYLLFQAIMNPGRLPERRFVWSGERIHKIYKEQILSSESPAKYYRAVQEIVKDRIIVGHTITSDQDALDKTGFELKPKQWKDITDYKDYQWKDGQNKSLEKCCAENSISKPNHNPIWDARAALILYFLIEPSD